MKHWKLNTETVTDQWIDHQASQCSSKVSFTKDMKRLTRGLPVFELPPSLSGETSFKFENLL